MHVAQKHRAPSSFSCVTLLFSTETECTVCRTALHTIPFQLPALSAGNLFKTSHKLSTALQQCISKLPLLSAKFTHSHGGSILGIFIDFVYNFLNAVTVSKYMSACCSVAGCATFFNCVTYLPITKGRKSCLTSSINCFRTTIR